MVAPCALCKARNPPRTHVFPQNSRAEVQLKWVKAMGLPQNEEEAVLEEMHQLELKGSRPRWCTFHFEYDSAGIHFPKYFDPEEGKTAQGWKDEEEKDDQGPSTNDADNSYDRSSSSPAEKRRSTRKRTAPPDPSPLPSSESPVVELSLKKILADVGISLPDMGEEEEEKDESPRPSTSRKKVEVATSVEKTLQSILMDAGLPVPETLQAKTGVLVDEEADERVFSPSLRRQIPFGATVTATKKATSTVGEARRQGTFAPARGGATLSNPKMLMDPMSNKYAGGEWPKIVIPKPTTPKIPVYCYNHNTMEKYDDSDSLRNFTMPCSSITKNCQSELTVIINRARVLEDQFDDLSNSVLRLVQMYKTKTPLAYRPPQSLATIGGRAASVAGPVIGRPLYNTKEVVPLDSLAVQERRERRLGSRKKEPERLLTDDDLASTVRRKLTKQEQSSAGEEEEEDEDDEMDEEDSESDDKEYRPSHSKRRRVSAREADASASEASPPMLDMIE